MKLYQSPTSPYVKMVRAAALAKGLGDRITLVDRTDDGIESVNPLNKVPTLVTDDGEVLIESKLICQYLDELGPASLYPADPAQRRRVLQREALIHGILDAVVLRRMETRRTDAERSAWWETRQKRKISGGLDLIESGLEDYTLPGTILPIALGSALDFTDRIAGAVDDLDWRRGRPRLTAWYEAYSQDPLMTDTGPVKSA